MSLPNVNAILELNMGQRPIGHFFAHRFTQRYEQSCFFSLIFLTDSYLNYKPFS